MLIESWLLWQMIEVTTCVLSGGFIFAYIIWNALEKENEKRKDKTCSKN